MNYVRLIKKFWSLSLRIKLLYLEAFFYLGWGRALKLFPFAKVAPFLGNRMEETDFYENRKNIILLVDISRAIHIMSRYTFWESECLVKAYAGMKMLERRKIESTLYLGTGKDKDGSLIAHAWLRSGTFYISGYEGIGKFTIVGKFAKEIVKNN